MRKNIRLYESVRNYAIAAIDLVVREPDPRCLSINLLEQPGIMFIFSDERLKKLPEYQECLLVLMEDKVITSQLGVLIGINIYAHVSPDINTLMLRLPLLAIYQKKLEFNPESFEVEYRIFEDVFYGNEIKYEVVVPITGQLLGKRLKLNPQIEICKVFKDDYKLMIPGSAPDPYLERSLWAIRVQYSLPKIVGQYESNLDEADKNDLLRDEANELIEKVISALRLFGVSNVHPVDNIHRAESHLFQQTKKFRVRSFPEFTPNFIPTGDVAEAFLEFWQNLEYAMTKYNFMNTAVRRYGYTQERHNLEDKIIDLSIAAEALYLSEFSGKTELSYRLKLHAAFFLGHDSESRKQIMDHMGHAYSLRSAIVHGSNDLKKVIKKIENTYSNSIERKPSIATFIYHFQSNIRTTIMKMIDLAISSKATGKSNTPLVDWNNLILGDQSEEA